MKNEWNLEITQSFFVLIVGFSAHVFQTWKTLMCMILTH
jgi:hypothetical protein